MLSDHPYKKQIVLIFSIIVATATGCDRIEQIKGNIFKKEQPQQQVVVAQPQAPSVQEKPKSGPFLVKVGNWSLTKEEFEERLAALKEVVPEYDITDPQARRLILDELVRQQLLVIDAEKRGIAKDKDIQAAVEEFRRTLIVREVAAGLIENIKVSDQEARQFYEEQKELLREPEEWRVREIVVSTQIKANEVLLEVLKGADFAELAREHSISKTASQGGDLGFLREEPFPAMVDALINMKEGDVSSVFKGPEGFYIVKLDEVRGGEQIPYEEIKEEIIQNRTLVKQQQAILEYIEKLEKEIKVEISEDLLR